MSTREDVARMAGVSGATVSYVLNNTKKVTPEVRSKVLKAAEKLGYKPNMVARSLVTKRTMHVALLVDNLTNPYYCQIAEGVQSIACEYGYLVSSLAVNVSNHSSILDLTSRGVDGIIFAVGSHDVHQYVREDIPTFFLWENEELSYKKAIFDMVHCLKECGHERIAFLSSIPIEQSNHYRYIHFTEALKQEGLPLYDELVVDGEPFCDTDEKTGMKAAMALLERKVPFTAVFAINDLMALGCYRQLRLHGYRVPEDVSLVGCDGIPITASTYPSLSTLDMKAYEVGKQMMKGLIHKMHPGWVEFHEGWKLEGEFVKRESVGEAPGKNEMPDSGCSGSRSHGQYAEK